MSRVFCIACRFTNQRVFIQGFFGHAATVRKLPWIEVVCWIIFDVLHIAAPLQYQCTQALLTQLFGCPATADAAANHNSIVGMRVLTTAVNMYVGCI